MSVGVQAIQSNSIQGFGALEQKKVLYLHSTTVSRAYVPDPFALDVLRSKTNILCKCPFKQDKSRASTVSDLAKPRYNGGPQQARDQHVMPGPHEELRRRTVMGIAQTAFATQSSLPAIKVLSPYPGRLLKAHLKRIQKDPEMHGPSMESCAGIRVRSEQDKFGGASAEFTRVGLSTRVRKHCQEDRNNRVVRHFLEDQTVGGRNLEEVSLADSVNLYKRKRTTFVDSQRSDSSDQLDTLTPAGRNSPAARRVSKGVEFLEDNDSDIEMYQINYLPDVHSSSNNF